MATKVKVLHWLLWSVERFSREVQRFFGHFHGDVRCGNFRSQCGWIRIRRQCA
jgi:hypothetical protein